MLDVYKLIRDNRTFKKFRFDDAMFVEYHCMLEELKSGYWTSCNYLIYIFTGKKVWRSLDKPFLGQPGDALFLKKGAYVAEQFFEEEFCSLVIFLSDDFIRNAMQQHDLRTLGKSVDVHKESIFKLHVDPSLQSYFHSVWSYFPQQRPPAKSLLKVKFEEFIINIMSNTHNTDLASYFEDIRFNTKTSVRDIMEANFAYNMNLEDFAKLTGRSLSSFHRDFKKEYQTSPSKWLTQRRLDHSKMLLETTDKNVSEIAFDSGFENPSHFIRVFKSKFRTTPLKFKQTVIAS